MTTGGENRNTQRKSAPTLLRLPQIANGGCLGSRCEKPATKRPRRDKCCNGGISVLKQFTYLFCQFVYSGHPSSSTGSGTDAASIHTLRGDMFPFPLPFVMPGGVSVLQNITVNYQEFPKISFLGSQIQWLIGRYRAELYALDLCSRDNLFESRPRYRLSCSFSAFHINVCMLNVRRSLPFKLLPKHHSWSLLISLEAI
jgi:hypothetical protein